MTFSRAAAHHAAALCSENLRIFGPFWAQAHRHAACWLHPSFRTHRVPKERWMRQTIVRYGLSLPLLLGLVSVGCEVSVDDDDDQDESGDGTPGDGGDGSDLDGGLDGGDGDGGT